ncbi:Sulfite exporter TauE/SafE family protein [Seminavis robusta]|uniref:Sulfite exporter TauE/SafE family protein n=1 Tax=Seminavis robusta TaxID=568900 RepID=A0A9N8EIX9_9STRA|nr:Sulfite exporter TauE/SafE family protein [Seminavis robusta]|eukprot:Sro1310_g261590.1 Sulfite exporter TauE/SafE family protein (592) ;mRNA; r:4169-6030
MMPTRSENSVCVEVDQTKQNNGRKRPLRKRLESCASDFRFTKAEWREMNPKLHSLLLPWALLAFVAIGSTILGSAYSINPTSNDIAKNTAIPVDFASWIPDKLERFLQDGTMDINSQGMPSTGGRRLKHHHHPPLLPLTTSDYWGFFLATLGLMVAAGGGIGGGGILVPIYSLVHGFSAKHAIPLSNVTVFGGAVANTLLNTPKRHPLADRPLVDWDLILVMEPLTIAGALLGAFLNKLLPEAILTVMLVALLSFTAYTSLTKAIKMYKIESIHLRKQGIREDGTKESELTKMAHGHDDLEDADASQRLLDDAEFQDSDDVDDNPKDSAKEEIVEAVDDDEPAILETEASRKQQLETILENERKVPMTNIHILVAVFVVVLAINLLKGGGAFPSPIGIKCGSTSFWLANGIMLGWIIVISFFVRAYLVNQYKIKQRVGYQYVEGDIKWDARATIVYPCVCCLAGFFAGMFGVGGGIVKGPLMLAMGVHPAVSSASSACMILFTSFTATTSFVVFGLLVQDYAIVCFLLGFFATFIGQVGLAYLMKKSQRNSYIAFSIGGVVLLSAILMTFQSLLSAAEGEHEKSGGICGTS